MRSWLKDGSVCRNAMGLSEDTPVRPQPSEREREREAFTHTHTHTHTHTGRQIDTCMSRQVMNAHGDHRDDGVSACASAM